MIEIEKGEYRELKILLYFLVNNDKKVLDSLYGKYKLMEDIKRKIEQVTNNLNYLFYYYKNELERQRRERLKKEKTREEKKLLLI